LGQGGFDSAGEEAMNSDVSDDEDIILRILCGEAKALRELLRRHLEPTKCSLERRHGAAVHSTDIDEAVNRAALTIWEKPDDFDPKRGNLAAWFYQLAEWALIDVYRKERRHRRKHPLIKDAFAVSDPCDDEPLPPPSKDHKQVLDDLKYVVDHKLKGNQQAIILADMLADGMADAASLAERLGTTKESIYVSRHKAHANIEKFMKERAQHSERLRGKT